MDPTISVVIPTYNRAAVVSQAIRSVLAQTFTDFELIVVDDASTDDTAAVVSRVQDPRVRLLRLDANGGVSRARNEGVRRARGGFVALLDDDDVWFPTLLERLTARLGAEADPRIGLVYAYYYKYHVPTGECEIPDHLAPLEGDILDRLLRGCFIQTSMMIRRSALLAIGGYDESLRCCEDYDVVLRLAAASHRVAVVAEPLVVYRDHDGPRLTLDPEAMLTGFLALRDRWGPVIRSRLGGAALRHWVAVHTLGWRFGAVGAAVDRGDRRAALGHCLALASCLPEPGVLRVLLPALMLATFGRRPYEALRRLKPLLRRAPGGAAPRCAGALRPSPLPEDVLRLLRGGDGTEPPRRRDLDGPSGANGHAPESTCPGRDESRVAFGPSGLLDTSCS